MKKGKIILTGIFIVILVYFLSGIDYADSKEAIMNSDFKLIIYGMLWFFVSYLLKSVRIKYLCHYYNEPLSLTKAFHIDVIAIAFASFTPGRVGEFSKILLFRKEGISRAKSLILPVIERLFDFIVIIILTMYFIINRIPNLNVQYGVYGFGIVIVFIFLVLFNLDLIIKILPKKLQKFESHIREIKLDYRRGSLYFVLLLSIIVWLSDGFAFYLVIKAFVDIPYWEAVGIFCGLVIFTVLSLLPSGLGSLDVSAFFLFKAVGISDSITLVILLFLRVVTFIYPLIMLVPVMPFVDFNLKEIKEKVMGRFKKDIKE